MTAPPVLADPTDRGRTDRGRTGEGPRDDEWDRDLRPRTKWALTASVIIPNVVGACVVFGLAGWVLPTRSMVADAGAALGENLVALVGYALPAGIVGLLWGLARMRVPPPPASSDPRALRVHGRLVRRVVLRGPMRLSVVQAVPWLVAIPLFAAINVAWSPRLAAVVALVVALGGLTTVAVSYRLSELVLRPEVGRVLAHEPPSRPTVPGVALRSLGSWVAGTGVPLLGVCLVAGAAVVSDGSYTVAQLGGVVLVIALLAVVVGFLVTALTAASISAPVLSVRRALQRVERGEHDVEVRVTDASELGLLQAGFNTMVARLREQDRIRDLFGRHVGREVARRALETESIELGGEEREVAVLFVDVVGSTSLAATRSPEQVVALLNAFFAVVVDVVEGCGGWINKFEGDGALAVFGAPTASDDAAGRALCAARGLAQRLADEVRAVRTGIGVSAGPAVAGNIGHDRRFEYTVIGDPVNEAARLSESAKDDRYDGVLASDAALRRADPEERRHWVIADHQVLRGRTRPTALAVPVGVRAALPAASGDAGRLDAG